MISARAFSLKFGFNQRDVFVIDKIYKADNKKSENDWYEILKDDFVFDKRSFEKQKNSNVVENIVESKKKLNQKNSLDKS